MAYTSHRPRLVPKAAVIAIAVIAGLITTAGLSAWSVSRARLVAVPDVTGVPSDTAKARLRDVDLGYEVTSTHVSVDVPAGHVIQQTPKARREVARGTVIGVVLSAGPQSFVIPDLVGEQFDTARDTLSDLGFEVVVDAVSSDTTSPVVLEMYPAPGTLANVGDQVRLSVPGSVDASQNLLPFDLTGLTVLLDVDAPPAGMPADVPMEVARRVRSLLEAAGATVSTTRPQTGAVATADERLAAARASTAALIVSIGVTSNGEPGIHVFYPKAGAHAASSQAYARSITRAATLPSLTVNEPAASGDEVLAAFGSSGVRIAVGDSTVPGDLQVFGDPTWADQVARAIYRGVGTTFTAE